jgi:hypothetical protein
MDRPLASQSSAIPIASALPRSLNRGSLAVPAECRAAHSYLSSRRASQSVASHLTATRIGTPNTNTKSETLRMEQLRCPGEGEHPQSCCH